MSSSLEAVEVPVEVLFLLSRSWRAQQLLEYLSQHRREATKDLLFAVFGRVSKDDHHLLVELAAMKLIKRYPGKRNGKRVIWNEITDLGRRVLEHLKELYESDGSEVG